MKIKARQTPCMPLFFTVNECVVSIVVAMLMLNRCRLNVESMSVMM